MRFTNPDDYGSETQFYPESNQNRRLISASLSEAGFLEVFAPHPLGYPGRQDSSRAEQDARANDLRCHAACYLTNVRNEAPDYESTCRTRRASEGRGSSMTFGSQKNEADAMGHPAVIASGVRRRQSVATRRPGAPARTSAKKWATFAAPARERR